MCSISLSMPTSTIDATTDAKVFQRLFDQQEKEVEEKMTDMMAVSISEVENKIHGCRASFNKEIIQASANDDNKGLTAKFVDLIYRRFNIIKKKLDYIGNFRMNYFLINGYGDSEDTTYQVTIKFSPTMIVDTPLHQLTDEQLKLLNRGPSYTPPCQMYVSSSYTFMNDMLQKHYKLLQHYLIMVFGNCGVNTARSMFINKEIKDAYKDTFSGLLPLSIQQRALYEKQLVQSVRKHLKANNLILRRTADNQNTFHPGNMKDFEEKRMNT